MTTTIFTTQSSGPPRGAVWVFKCAAAVTFAVGVVAHFGHMVIGAEAFARTVLAPPADTVFAFIALTAALSGLVLWPRYSGGRAGQLGYAVAILVLVTSVPLHVGTAAAWGADYFSMIPSWYSAIEVPMFFTLIWTVIELKFEDAVPSTRVTSAHMAEHLLFAFDSIGARGGVATFGSDR